MSVYFGRYGLNLVLEDAESYIPPPGTQTSATPMFTNVTANIVGGITG
jgi:hypothetical protein